MILVAVEDRAYEGGEIHINKSHLKIRTNNIGLFFASSADQVKMAWLFCMEHHAHEYNPEKIFMCNCRKNAQKKAYSQVMLGNWIAPQSGHTPTGQETRPRGLQSASGGREGSGGSEGGEGGGEEGGGGGGVGCGRRAGAGGDQEEETVSSVGWSGTWATPS